MTYKDRLGIVVRVFGAYVLWRAFESMLSAIAIGFSIPKQSQLTEMLSVFSGGTTRSLFVFQYIGLYVFIQGMLGSVLIVKAKTLAGWLTKGFPDTNDALLPHSYGDTLTLVIQTLGLVLFGTTVYSMNSVFSSLFLYADRLLSNPLFLLFCARLAVSVGLIMRAPSIVKWIGRISR